MRSKPAVPPPAVRHEQSAQDAAAEESAVAAPPPETAPGDDESAAMPPEAPQPRNGTEIELKLLVDPADMAAFETAPVIEENARSRGVRRRLHAVYYDTRRRDLRRAGIALRVRRSGNRYIQTVKSFVPDDPLRRGEWEAVVPDEALDLTLALPFLPAKLRNRLLAQPPEPVFRTEIRRLIRTVTLPAGRVEVAFDVGRLIAGDAELPVAEIELELKDGAPQALYELALRLLDHGPARPSILAKSARGYDLADGTPPGAPKPRRPAVAADAALDDALDAIFRAIFGHLLEALPAAEDGRGPEGVHQARVALRRLRSLFGLLRPVAPTPAMEALRAEAGRLADALGNARDTDVFITETLKTVETALPALGGFDALRQLAEAQRAGHYAAARRALADPRTSWFILELGSWIEQRAWRNGTEPDTLGILAAPAADFAAATLAGLHDRVRKRGKHFRTMAPEARHRLRIAVKKLRYATDFLAPILGESKALKRYLARVATLQDQLGRYNDMATTARIVSALSADPAAQNQAAGAIVGWQAQGLVGAEPGLRYAWERFCEARPPWKRPD